MKLYYMTGACSLAVRIALLEAGLEFTSIPVDMMTKTLQDGSDFRAINPQGSVPVLELANGERLTEVSAILQYIADLAPDSGLAPQNGTFARTRLQETLNFISSEIHKSWHPRFNPALDDAAKSVFADRLKTKYALVDSRLANSTWVTGETFTVADAYLFVTTLWRNFLTTDLSGLTSLESFIERAKARPSVSSALKAEGLA